MRIKTEKKDYNTRYTIAYKYKKGFVALLICQNYQLTQSTTTKPTSQETLIYFKMKTILPIIIVLAGFTVAGTIRNQNDCLAKGALCLPDGSWGSCCSNFCLQQPGVSLLELFSKFLFRGEYSLNKPFSKTLAPASKLHII